MSIFKCSGRNGYLHGEFTEVFPFLKECPLASSFIWINCEAKPALMKSCWPTHCVEQLCVTISPEVALYLLPLCSPEGLILTFIVSLLSFWPVLLFQLCPVFKLPPVLRTTSCVFQCHAEKWCYGQSLAYPMTGHQHDTAELDHAMTDCILLPLGLPFAIVYSPRSPSVPQDTFLLSSQCGHAQRNSFPVLHHFHPSVF